MVSIAAHTAISAALTAARVAAPVFQDGPSSTLLIVGRPLTARQFPASTAFSAIRENGLRIIGTRILRDGRTAIEFGENDRPGGGIATLCDRNVALGLDQLASQGWTVA